jgi:hypothetical protein
MLLLLVPGVDMGAGDGSAGPIETAKGALNRRTTNFHPYLVALIGVILGR